MTTFDPAVPGFLDGALFLAVVREIPTAFEFHSPHVAIVDDVVRSLAHRRSPGRWLVRAICTAYVRAMIKFGVGRTRFERHPGACRNFRNRTVPGSGCTAVCCLSRGPLAARHRSAETGVTDSRRCLSGSCGGLSQLHEPSIRRARSVPHPSAFSRPTTRRNRAGRGVRRSRRFEGSQPPCDRRRRHRRQTTVYYHRRTAPRRSDSVLDAWGGTPARFQAIVPCAPLTPEP